MYFVAWALLAEQQTDDIQRIKSMLQSSTCSLLGALAPAWITGKEGQNVEDKSSNISNSTRVVPYISYKITSFLSVF